MASTGINTTNQTSLINHRPVDSTVLIVDFFNTFIQSAAQLSLYTFPQFRGIASDKNYFFIKINFVNMLVA
jgi:hypothetical protein